MPKKSVQKRGFKSGGWKAVQSKRQNTKKTKLALGVFGLIIALLLLAQAVKFTNMLFSPWKEQMTVKRKNLWQGDFNLNLVIKSKGISLLSFNPKEGKVTVIEVPENTYLSVPKGFGEWQLGSVYDLGESQKGLGGGKLLKKTLESLFGLPIEGIINLTDGYSLKDSGLVVSELRKSPFSILEALPHLKTNLTPYELVRFNMGLSSVRFDKIKQINLGEDDNLLQKDKLLDGTEILIPDEAKLDSIVSNLVDPTIREEHKTIAIFNSTSRPGLAQKAARMITNIGGNVIITSNGQKQLKKTVVTGEESKTLNYLKRTFNADDIIEPNDKEIVSSRAQINVFLGEDYIE